MRGKKKRRVSVRHISPRWSRVLNSERRATSGWDPPLRAFSLPTPSPLHPPFHPLESVSCATNDSYAAMPLSKFDRTAFSVSFRPTCTSREPSLAPFHARSSTSWNGLKLGKWRAIRCSPTPICHDCSSSTMLIPETWTYIRFNSIGIWSFLFLSYFPTATFDTMNTRLLRITLRPRLRLIKRSEMSTHLGYDRGIVEVRAISRSGR